MKIVTFYIGYTLGIQVVGLLQGKFKKIVKNTTKLFNNIQISYFVGF